MIGVFGGSQTGFFWIFPVPQQHHQPPARTGAAECHQGTDEHTQKGFYNQPDFTTDRQCCWKLGPVQKNTPAQPSARSQPHTSVAQHTKLKTLMLQGVVWALQITSRAWKEPVLVLSAALAVGTAPRKAGGLEAVHPTWCNPPKERGHMQKPQQNMA